jgi:hypothetical protein
MRKMARKGFEKKTQTFLCKASTEENKLEFGREVRGMSQELVSDSSRRLELQLVEENKGPGRELNPGPPPND